MSSGIRGRPSFFGLFPGVILAALIIFAGGYYSLRNAASPGGGGDGLSANFVGSLLFSLEIAAISTLCSLVIGVALALWLWKQPVKFPGQLYVIPLILPHLMAAFFVVVFFSQSGILSSLLYHLNIIDDLRDFPVMVFDNQGIGIILAYIYKETAFVVLIILASLRKIPPHLMQTSNMLGASRWKSYRSIISPHILPSLWVTGIIIFLYSFGAYDIPFLIGSSTRPMVSLEAYRLFFDGSLAQRPAANLLLAAIWIISLCFLLLFILIRAVFSRREEKRLWM